MLPTTERALFHRLARAQSEGRAPSVVAGIVRDDALAWFGGRGEVDGRVPGQDTGYRIGSITKTFVAVLVLRLRDEGRLALNDQIGDHLPGSPFGATTVAQLLSHTGGLTSESPGDWWERVPGAGFAALRESMATEPKRLVPGTGLHYSNVGFGVLGELVASLRGRSWYDVLRAEVLEPLGMRRTTPEPRSPHALGWAVHPHADVLLPEPAEDAGAMAPAGQLWSTADDLARWLRFLGGDTGEVLHPDTMAEMRRPAAVDDGDEWVTAWGLGVQLRRWHGRRLAGHGGSMPGFLACVYVEPATRTGVLTMANSTAGVPLGALTDDLLDIVAAHEPVLPPVWRPLPSVREDLLELTGDWYWGPAPFRLTLLAGDWLDLAPAAGGGRASRFRPIGKDTWAGLDGYYAGETLRLVRDAEGAPSHFDLATFVFTRRPYDNGRPIPGGVDERGWRTGPT
jgi:CubicO group peptidase (beta-lactamase class C family)